MSESRFVAREPGRDWTGTVHGRVADHAVAALNADPVTLDELASAATRFAKQISMRRHFAGLSPGLCDEQVDAGLVVIDLVVRLIVVDSIYTSPGLRGTVLFHEGRQGTGSAARSTAANSTPSSRSASASGWRILRPAQPVRMATGRAASAPTTLARCRWESVCLAFESLTAESRNPLETRS
jgi:hypothetical protein